MMRWNAIAAGLVSLVLSGFLSSGSCTITYTSCTSHCDVCDPNCECFHGSCHSAASNGAPSSRRLEAFDHLVIVDADARVTRAFTHILGVSLARDLDAGQNREDGARDLARFSEEILSVNRDILGRDTWHLESVDVFETVTVITYRETGSTKEAGSLTFLYDRRGNLLEIDVQSSS